MVLRYFILFFILIQSFYAIAQNDSKINSLKIQITNKPTKSLKVINKLLLESNTTTLDSAKLFDLKGQVLENDQNILNAISIYQKSYDLYEKLNNKSQQVVLLNKISNLYIITEEFSKVIDIQNSIAKLLKNVKDKELLSSRHTSNMALMFFKTGAIKKAKLNFYKAIKIAKTRNETVLLNYHYKDLSRVFISTNELDSALYYSNKALTYSFSSKNNLLTSALFINKGDIYEKFEEFIKAELQYQKAIKVLDAIGVNNANIYIKLGNFYKRVKLYDFANENFKKAISKTINTGDNDKILGLYHDLMENSILQKMPRRAYYYLQKYDSLNRINLREEKKRNIAYINERYNIQKEEIVYLNNKHKLLEKENELIKQREITKKNKLINSTLLILFSVMLLMGILSYRFNKLKNEKQNIQLKNTVLRLQMNPHFIFNSLTAIQNTILKNDPLKSAELIAIFSKLIRQNLDFSVRKSISLNEEIDMLTNYLKTQQFRFNNIFLFKIEIDPKIDCEETQIPPMLIQPFVENAIEHGLKHKDKGGKIRISIIKKEKGIYISVTDNGIGFKTSKKYNRTDENTDKINAIKIFKERLKIRQKNEESSFKITNITDSKNNTTGTKIEFTLKNL